MGNGSKAVIVSAARTPVGRAKKGTLTNTRPDDLAAVVIKEVVERGSVKANDVEDVIMGCAMPEREQGLNIARISALIAGLPVSVCGVTINRFCSSGLQAIAMAAQTIQTGMTRCVIAGGVESMSKVPMSGYKFSPNPAMVGTMPEVYISMGITAENVAGQYNISRQAQDEFALWSHEKAAAAQDSGKFHDEIVPVPVRVDNLDGTKVVSETVMFKQDELIRRDTSLEKLAQLPPSFKVGGSVTAGNSSPLSDGASAVLMMSADMASELGVKPIARFVTFAVSGVRPEIMGIGPVVAIPKALKQAGLTMKDIDLIELNEAFAAQALAVIDDLDLPKEKVNINGGAIALGHPLGCSGAKLTVTAIHELRRRDLRCGMITMCIGGGQGASGIIEVI